VSRIRTALRRGLAKADTWVAAVALWLSGLLAANDQWLGAVVVGLAGFIFLVSAGDYCWRRGYTAGRHDGEA
jgi:hypothetical protein